MCSSHRLLPITLLLVLGGCGTVHNLYAPPEKSGPIDVPETCTPFGGVIRSGYVGVFGIPVGLMYLLDDHYVEGGQWCVFGVLAWADVPVSLAGDLITFPVAYARRKKQPWATWWGEPHSPKLLFPFLAPPRDTPVSDEAPAHPAHASERAEK